MVSQLTLQSINFISAELTFPGTFPKCFTYATRVSGWFVIYMQRKVDLEATGSDMALLVLEWDGNMYGRLLQETSANPGRVSNNSLGGLCT